MLFSYYFDVEKKHLLNFSLSTLQYSEKAEGSVEIMLSAKVTEIMDGIQKRQEVQVGTFTFPYTTDATKHDIDSSRVRYGKEKKWIFQVTNNKNNAQKITVGLISNTANKNPLGVDIYQDEEGYQVALKGNNLSILENSYVPPVLTQTVANSTFDTAGYPERFTSQSAQYESRYLMMSGKDFRQDFLDAIPVNTPFTIKLDIAPMAALPTEGTKLFDIVVPNLGTVSLTTISLDYLIHNGTGNDTVKVLFDKAIAVEDLFQSGVKSNAKLTIIGDGSGNVTVSYNGKTLNGVYDSSQSFMRIILNGETVNNNLLSCYFDNISVTYRK